MVHRPIDYFHEAEQRKAEAAAYPEAAKIARETALSFGEAKRLWLALGDKAAVVAAHCSRNAISSDDVLTLIESSRGRRKTHP